jgi:hypothetical protein
MTIDKYGKIILNTNMIKAIKLYENFNFEIETNHLFEIDISSSNNKCVVRSIRYIEDIVKIINYCIINDIEVKEIEYGE